MIVLMDGHGSPADASVGGLETISGYIRNLTLER